MPRMVALISSVCGRGGSSGCCAARCAAAAKPPEPATTAGRDRELRALRRQPAERKPRATRRRRGGSITAARSTGGSARRTLMQNCGCRTPQTAAARMRPMRRATGLFGRDGRTPDSFWTSLRYFNIYRMAVAALFLGITCSTAMRSTWAPTASTSSAGLRGLSGAALVFHSLLRNLRDLFNLQLSAHIALDIVAITLLMYASGGSIGPGVMLLIALTGAALVAPRALALLYAALAAIALLLEQGYWVLQLRRADAEFPAAALLAIGCFAAPA
jgi:hypothetical protein